MTTTASAVTWRSIELSAGQELRVEIEFDKELRLKLQSGLAEVFGMELGIGIEYVVSGRKLAVFTYHGCTIDLSGDAAVEYVAGETPMMTYLNAHMALEDLRKSGAGPKIMVVGPSDVGKSSLCKILLNYAVRMQHKPLFVDLDTNEGSLSIPGTIASTPIPRPVSLEEDFSSVFNEVISFYYGYPTPLDKPKLYSRLCGNMATAVLAKVEDDAEVKKSGIIVNTPSHFSESGGFELLTEAVDKFNINVIFVLSHERLYADLTKQYSSNTNIKVIKLAKSGGVVSRDKTYRRALTNAKIKEYFYGTPKYDLHPYREIIKFDHVRIRRVGESTPLSALPIASTPLVTETRFVKVEPSDILLHSVVAVSQFEGTVDVIGEDGKMTKRVVVQESDEESEFLLKTNLAGFIYISEVDEAKRKFTVLSPTPGRGLRRYLIMAALKWIES